jgi:epoxyqueuosine reductase
MNAVDWQTLSNLIEQWGQDLGFSAVGITDIQLDDAGLKLQEWLKKGRHGEMAYMAAHGDMRWQPQALHPNTQSIVSLRLDYLEHEPDPQSLLEDSDTAYISRYALGRDYHKVIRGKLKRLVQQIDQYLSDNQHTGFDARVFTDSAPILEKALAEKAGLGWIGKNTLLLNENAGSWFFLGEVLTNLPLPETGIAQTNRCGSCSACIDVCPTNAIVAPYELDARLCISYLTIEHRGSIPVELREPMGNRVFGCDDCQLVCPWNRYAAHNAEADFKPRHGLQAPQLIELFNWDEQTFLTKTEGSPIRRTGYHGWLRNLAIGLGNSLGAADPGVKKVGVKKVIESLKARLGKNDLVDEHIDWAVQKQVSSIESQGSSD